MYTLNNLKEQVSNIGKFAHSENVYFEEDSDKKLRFKIYTDNNSYSVVATIDNNGHSYLGCVASNRKPRAGETWTRGNDLADGNLSQSTWNNILSDIVSYELVRIHKNDKTN
ncbi:MAG: hypothetical protein DRQ58_06790 [Gammaproteobacteria bacterium]|nr:MAG: hypothetical protein DRQ58_06790 [Gammaproteobacteria bacterium]